MLFQNIFKTDNKKVNCMKKSVWMNFENKENHMKNDHKIKQYNICKFVVRISVETCLKKFAVHRLYFKYLAITISCFATFNIHTHTLFTGHTSAGPY